MIAVSASDRWKAANPEGVIGLLELSGVEQPLFSTPLDERKREVEARLREKYAYFLRKEFLALPVMEAYNRYYRRFDKTFHVLLQVESIALKSRHLPSIVPLVDANFMAEVETFVLTAGHDARRLIEPVRIDISQPGDRMTPMGGTHRPITPGDMVMRDRRSVRCSILHGQDDLSPITAGTAHVLYVAYAPMGVPPESVKAHLEQVEENVRLFAPQAVREQSRLLRAD